MSETDETGLEPAGVPTGGLGLNADDAPTGNDGSLGSDPVAGDAGLTQGEDALTEDDARADETDE